MKFIVVDRPFFDRTRAEAESDLRVESLDPQVRSKISRSTAHRLQRKHS